VDASAAVRRRRASLAQKAPEAIAHLLQRAALRVAREKNADELNRGRDPSRFQLLDAALAEARDGLEGGIDALLMNFASVLAVARDFDMTKLDIAATSEGLAAFAHISFCAKTR